MDELTHRYLTDQLSEEERIKYETWLDVLAKQNEKEVIVTLEDEERIARKIISANIGINEIASYRPGRSRFYFLLNAPMIQVAAALFLVVTLASVIWLAVIRNDEVKVIAVNKIEKVILKDGTIVWLHKGAILTYDDNFNTSDRKVNLSGEALFEVAKDPAHPFSITSGKMIVKVHGTSFNLKTVNKQLELDVLTGKVSVSSAFDPDGVTVEANEKISYAETGLLKKAKVNAVEVSQMIDDTEYNMQFNDLTMDVVLNRIQAKFNVTTKVSDRELLTCHITADLTDHSLDKTLFMISQVLDMKYEIINETILINGRGCK